MSNDGKTPMLRTLSVVAFTVVLMQTLMLFAILLRQTEIMRTRGITIDQSGHVIAPDHEHVPAEEDQR